MSKKEEDVKKEEIKKEETKTEENDSLKETLRKTEEGLKKKEEPTEETKKEAPKKEEAKKEEVSDSSKEDLSPEDLVNAKNLFKALKDPEASKVVLKTLAEKAGILKAESKEEKEEIAETVISVLEKSLGAKFPLLAKQLGPAIDQAIDLKLSKINKSLEESKVDKRRTEAEAAWDKLETEFPQLKELEEDVVSLMDEIKPGDTTTPYSYFKRLLQSAAAEKGITLGKTETKETKKTETVNKEREEINRNDAFSRTASEGSPSSEKVENQDLSLKEAVAAAAKELDAAMKS